MRNLKPVTDKLLLFLWRKFQFGFYYVGLPVAFFLNHVLARCIVTGPRLPRNAPVLFTMNHISMWDLPAMYPLGLRPFHYMGKVELFKIPIVGGLCWALGAFPVERGKADRQAIQRAISYLKEGSIVGICPEGHRSPNQQLQTGLNGAALLAVNAPPETLIVPVAVWGTEYMWQKRKGPLLLYRPKTYVRMGQPYQIKRNENGKHGDLDEITELMMLKIAELLPEEYRGAYRTEEIEKRKQERERIKQEREAKRAARRALKS